MHGINDTPYRLLSIVSAFVYLLSLLVAAASFFPSSVFHQFLDREPIAIAVPVLSLLLFIPATRGAAIVTRDEPLLNYWTIVLSGAPRWMIRALIGSYILGAVVLVAGLAAGNKKSSMLFTSLTGITFASIDTVILYSIGTILNSTPPVPGQLRFIKINGARPVKIHRFKTRRQKNVRGLIPLLAVPVIIISVRLYEVAHKASTELSLHMLLARMIAPVIIISIMFAATVFLFRIIARSTLICDQEGLFQLRFYIPRRVRWEEITLVKCHRARFHDENGWSPRSVEIHGNHGFAIVVDENYDDFKKFETVLGKQLKEIFGVSYASIRRAGWWGERPSWFLALAATSMSMTAVIAFYLGLVIALLYGSEWAIRITGL